MILFLPNDTLCIILKNSHFKLSHISVWSYVIPWESRVNSWHLRFSCSEFYADSKKIGCHFFRSPSGRFPTPRGHDPYISFIYLFIILNTCLTSRVTHQNDRNFSGNIIKLKKQHFETLRWSFQGQLLQSFQIYILVLGSVTMHPPPPTYSPPPTFF